MSFDTESFGPSPENMGLTDKETQSDKELAQKPENLPDRREEVPDLKLFEGEKVINVEKPDIATPTQDPVAIEALMTLTDAEYEEEIGKKGPSVASRAALENQQTEELRLYEVLFGRDSLRVAQDVFDFYPELLKSTVSELAKLQGVETNPNSEEEPGRIIHENRPPEDPIAVRLTETLGQEWPSYASVDATPMYISSVKKVVYKFGPAFLDERYEGRDGKGHTIFESVQKAMNWVEGKLDSNPEGLLEFRHAAPGTTPNQVWKDSPDSYFHTDGELANHDKGIASIEVQALTHDALLDAADLYEQKAQQPRDSKLASHAERFRDLAENIKQTVKEQFWIEDERGGYFALGSDRDANDNLRLLKIRTSNMGHLLNSRILDGDDERTNHMRQETIRTLFSPEMLNVSGIRTLSNQEARFRSGAYHNGSVWLWDTYYIAQGLERHGYHGLSLELKNRLWNVIDKTKRFPEYARGGDESEPKLNDRVVGIWDEKNRLQHRLEQPPQEIQAWTVAAVVSTMHKHNPFADTHHVPSEAGDPEKLEFEKEILSQIHPQNS